MRRSVIDQTWVPLGAAGGCGWHAGCVVHMWAVLVLLWRWYLGISCDYRELSGTDQLISLSAITIASEEETCHAAELVRAP